ncbi:hypothetical protein FG05_35111 [Fusarium graminearum]|nr:hypothetical protein FG05_35111 [Fusarium graminearum]
MLPTLFSMHSPNKPVQRIHRPVSGPPMDSVTWVVWIIGPRTHANKAQSNVLYEVGRWGEVHNRILTDERKVPSRMDHCQGGVCQHFLISNIHQKAKRTASPMTGLELGTFATGKQRANHCASAATFIKLAQNNGAGNVMTMEYSTTDTVTTQSDLCSWFLGIIIMSIIICRNNDSSVLFLATATAQSNIMSIANHSLCWTRLTVSSLFTSANSLELFEGI